MGQDCHEEDGKYKPNGVEPVEPFFEVFHSGIPLSGLGLGVHVGPGCDRKGNLRRV